MSKDLSRDEQAAWHQFLQAANAGIVDDMLKIRTFSGSDIRTLLYIPPNDLSTEHKFGYVEELKTIQTLTLSSHRPPAPVRRLGNASAKYARGVRTLAGTLIFGRTDTSPFINAFGQCDHERPDIFPFFLDQMPPFHLIIHAQNEMGIQASMAILFCHITDSGHPFSVDDLTQEDTYSYVCEYAQPFTDRDNWRSRIRDMETDSGVTNVSVMRASVFKPHPLSAIDEN